MKTSNKNNHKNILILSIVLITGIVLRFINLNWDQGHHLHPDERLYTNASSIRLPTSFSEFLDPFSPLNPNMFYYGSFPLYLYKVLTVFANTLSTIPISFILTSRFVSATVSSITIVVLYFATKSILSTKASIIATILFAFSVGSIQYSHFNTTESLLTLYTVVLLYLSNLLLNTKITSINKVFKIGVFIGFILGLAGATKITGLSLGIIPFTSLVIILIQVIKNRNFAQSLHGLIVVSASISLITLLISIIGSPYNIIDFQKFMDQQTYMQGVILGTNKPPFTIIYNNTASYVYQITRIFPWITSPAITILSLGGWLAMWIHGIKKDKRLFILLIFPIIYFLYTGAWYAKFTRYMIPLVPFLCIYTAYFLQKIISSKKLKILGISLATVTISLTIVQSILFTKEIYYKEHTRISASRWIYNNIPNESIIASEHWDDPLPLILRGQTKNYTKINLAVYDIDNSRKVSQLSHDISSSDYIVLSSRRVFYSILQNKQDYPQTSNMYEMLFDGNLGYDLVHLEKRDMSIGKISFDDNLADESFQSYDHPPVYIFENTKNYSQKDIFKLINSIN